MGIGGLDSFLHSLLLLPQALNNETKIGVEGVELSQFLILGVGLELQFTRLDFLRRNLLLQLLDAVIEHELELLQLLSLPLQLVNFNLSVSDLSIFLSDMLMERLYLILETLHCVLLLFNLIVLVIDISL